MLEVRELRKSFDGFQAVGGVSFSVPRGSVSAIIGPNGAGKTTLFNLITGHLRADAGSVRFKDREVTGIAPHDLCGLGMGRSFQRTNIFPRLTVFQNIQAAFLCHRGRGWNLLAPVDRFYQEETEALLDSVGLLDKEDELAVNLSHGEQRNLEIAIALATDPQLLCLDEPTAGMSVTETHATVELVRRIGRNLTILVVEHDMEVVMNLAHRITVLHYGEVLAEGTPEEIQANPRVQEVYLKG